jgi:hypothetical protein
VAITQKARPIAGPWPQARYESAPQHGKEAVRHRLVEDVVIQCVEKVFSVALPGEKVPDIPVD